MSILPQIEPIVEATPARPLQDTLAELNKLAQAQPKSPLPPLASVVVSGFAHTELGDAKAHLTQAATLLRSAPPADPDTQFSQALYDVITAQFAVIAAPPPKDEADALATLPAFAAERKKTSDGLKRMAALAASNQLGATSLPNTLIAMIQTQDRTIEPNDRSFAAGVSALDHLRSSGATQNLAAFFLLYAHRRAHKYSDAIRVGQELEKKLPNSAMVKHAIGTAYFHSFDDANTERYYNAAKALAPNEPSISLSMASFYVRRGDVDMATKCADAVAALDPAGKLATYQKRAVAVIDRQKALQKLLSQP